MIMGTFYSSSCLIYMTIFEIILLFELTMSDHCIQFYASQLAQNMYCEKRDQSKINGSTLGIVSIAVVKYVFTNTYNMVI